MSHRAHNWSKLQKAGGPGRKGLLLLIADMCDENLECFPSIALLAQIMETSERYIRGMLQDLENAKLIASEFRYRNGRRTSSKYRVLVPEGFVEVSASTHYRNHSSATTGTMVPKLPEPSFLAEPPYEPPVEPPENQSSTSSPTLVGPPTAGVAGATPHPAAITDDDEPEPANLRARRVGKQRREECNRYIDLMRRLDDHAVEDALLKFHKDRKKEWRWAYNKAASAYGVPQRPPGTDEEYVRPVSVAHARLVYEKALRLSSGNPDWEEVLIEPLDALKHTDQSPPWAA